MARALPFYTHNLFELLSMIGWPQMRCAAALGLSIQAINNWASGRMQVPARKRAALIDLADVAMGEAEAHAAHDPAEQAALTARLHHYLSRWTFENLDKRGVTDAGYAALAQELTLLAKTKLSEQSPAALERAHTLHLEAAHSLRLILRLRETSSTLTTLEPNYGPGTEPRERLWAVAEWFAGERLSTPASTERVRQDIIKSLTQKLADPTLTDEQRQWVRAAIERGQALQASP